MTVSAADTQNQILLMYLISKKLQFINKKSQKFGVV